MTGEYVGSPEFDPRRPHTSAETPDTTEDAIRTEDLAEKTTPDDDLSEEAEASNEATARVEAVRRNPEATGHARLIQLMKDLGYSFPMERHVNVTWHSIGETASSLESFGDFRSAPEQHPHEPVFHERENATERESKVSWRRRIGRVTLRLAGIRRTQKAGKVPHR